MNTYLKGIMVAFCALVMTVMVGQAALAWGGGRGGMVCAQNFRPVCGTNGVTYSNTCMAQISGVGVAYNGRCVSRWRGW